MKEINNYTNKPISEFTENDTLYFSKVVSGFSITFHVRFIKFEKGIITGEILDIQPNNRTYIWIGKILYENGITEISKDLFDEKLNKILSEINSLR